MRSIKKRMKKKGGFTLIELLIVIGLLGALTALILPTLTANREDALGDICDYNQAGTVRVLKQYENLIGGYPAGMHVGMDGVLATSVAMGGLPEAQAYNVTANDPLDMDGDGATNDGVGPTRLALTDDHVASLQEAGITQVCSGDSLSCVPVATGVNVLELTDAWLDDSGAAFTFDGQTLAQWRAKTNSPAATTPANGSIIALWIAPTIDWQSGSGDNNDWTKGNVQIAIELEGKCPIPTGAVNGEVDFAYYMAFFLVDNDDVTSPAKLIGTSCPECGVMNP